MFFSSFILTLPHQNKNNFKVQFTNTPTHTSIRTHTQHNNEKVRAQFDLIKRASFTKFKLYSLSLLTHTCRI